MDSLKDILKNVVFRYDDWSIIHNRTYHKHKEKGWRNSKTLFFLSHPSFLLFSFIQLPGDTPFSDYVTYIKSFPLNDDPSIFGLHENADISYAQAETHACLETLLALQPKEVSGAASASTEDVSSKLATRILEELPPLFNLNKFHEK